jgi:hypothetical protein
MVKRKMKPPVNMTVPLQKKFLAHHDRYHAFYREENNAYKNGNAGRASVSQSFVYPSARFNSRTPGRVLLKSDLHSCH